MLAVNRHERESEYVKKKESRMAIRLTPFLVNLIYGEFHRFLHSHSPFFLASFGVNRIVYLWHGGDLFTH